MATHIQRNYKNGLFLMIFGNKPALLNLYNAVRGSHYTDPDNLIINTIEGVLYLGMKNDVSFIINNELNLYEAQASWNPNMPLRGLFYFSRVYEGYIAEHELNIYSQTMISLPSPNYIVFYNGSKEEGDSRILHLSDSFIKHDGQEACLECTATMININYGHNQKLMDSCRELYEYSYLIEQIRIALRNKYPLSKAVDLAVANCIDNDILKNFLLRHQSEVKHMILEEFDWEKHLRLVKKESYVEGFSTARDIFQRLLADSRIDDLKRAAEDPEYLDLLLAEYHLNDQ